MSRNGLTTSECNEILKEWRSAQLGVDDTILVKLASGFALSALIDIDPNDIAFLLRPPGEQAVFVRTFSNSESPDSALAQILAEAERGPLPPNRGHGGLLIITLNSEASQRHWGEPISMMMNRLKASMDPQAMVSFGIHIDDARTAKYEMMLVLSGDTNAD